MTTTPIFTAAIFYSLLSQNNIQIHPTYYKKFSRFLLFFYRRKCRHSFQLKLSILNSSIWFNFAELPATFELSMYQRWSDWSRSRWENSKEIRWSTYLNSAVHCHWAAPMVHHPSPPPPTRTRPASHDRTSLWWRPRRCPCWSRSSLFPRFCHYLLRSMSPKTETTGKLSIRQIIWWDVRVKCFANVILCCEDI